MTAASGGLQGARDDAAVPVQSGRYLADQIPAAHMVELDGADHAPWFTAALSVSYCPRSHIVKIALNSKSEYRITHARGPTCTQTPICNEAFSQDVGIGVNCATTRSQRTRDAQ
jgi:hypothetical protein